MTSPRNLLTVIDWNRYGSINLNRYIKHIKHNIFSFVSIVYTAYVQCIIKNTYAALHYITLLYFIFLFITCILATPAPRLASVNISLKGLMHLFDWKPFTFRASTVHVFVFCKNNVIPNYCFLKATCSVFQMSAVLLSTYPVFSSKRCHL